MFLSSILFHIHQTILAKYFEFSKQIKMNVFILWRQNINTQRFMFTKTFTHLQ